MWSRYIDSQWVCPEMSQPHMHLYSPWLLSRCFSRPQSFTRSPSVSFTCFNLWVWQLDVLIYSSLSFYWTDYLFDLLPASLPLAMSYSSLPFWTNNIFNHWSINHEQRVKDDGRQRAHWRLICLCYNYCWWSRSRNISANLTDASLLCHSSKNIVELKYMTSEAKVQIIQVFTSKVYKNTKSRQPKQGPKGLD